MIPNNNQYSCEIAIDPNGFDLFLDYLAKCGEHYSCAVIFSNAQVFPFYGEKIKKALLTENIRVEQLLVPAGEEAKTIEMAANCWKQLFAMQVDRHSLIIALGGGTTIDLAGFVASTYMRGIDLMLLPTTLLAMVDGAIGGKNGVNLAQAKNLVGTIYHPKLVLIDPRCLQSLPAREVRSGLAEVIKHAVIDVDLFAYLEHNMLSILQLQPEKIATVISRSCQIKSEIIQRNEREPWLRDLLNYGHTFAHAIESATEYKIYSHGEAVSIGMSCAALLSQKLGLVGEAFVQRQDALCRLAGLPTELPAIPTETLLDLMAKDKKNRAGHTRFILTQGLGKLSTREVERSLVAEVLNNKRAVEDPSEGRRSIS